MEARVLYWPSIERPRLTVVTDGAATYSPLPHEIMRDTSLSRDARLLYAILQSYWWQAGECFASHATLAAEMGCKERMLRYYVGELLKAGKITERRRGHGQAKAYAPANSTPQPATERQLNRQEIAALPPNRQEIAGQPATERQLNRQEIAARNRHTEEDSSGRKKTPECVPADAGMAPPAGYPKAKRVTVAFSSLSEDARRVVDDWRSKQGKPRPPTFNPEQARYLEDAVVDLGVDRLLESNTWAAQNGVPEFVKAIRAARTKRKRDEAGPTPGAPYRNGTSPAPAKRQMSSWAEVAPKMGGAAQRGGPQNKGQGDGRV